MMRTTLSLPEDVYEVARALANYKRISLGDAVAELVRRGLEPGTGLNSQTPFPSFDIHPDSPLITLEETLDAEEDL